MDFRGQKNFKTHQVLYVTLFRTFVGAQVFQKYNSEPPTALQSVFIGENVKNTHFSRKYWLGVKQSQKKLFWKTYGVTFLDLEDDLDFIRTRCEHKSCSK